MSEDIRKKFSKLTTKELKAKIDGGKMSIEEATIAKSVYAKRLSTTASLKSAVEAGLPEVAEVAEAIGDDAIIDAIADNETMQQDLTGEQAEIVDNLITVPLAKEKATKGKKVKKEKTEKVAKVPVVVLSAEDSENIASVVVDFKGSKRDLVITLLNTGFTCQQIAHYKPAIAHTPYIYSLKGKELSGKDKPVLNLSDYDVQLAGCETKSDKIRALNTAGVARGDIATLLGVHYSHVFSVLTAAKKAAEKPAKEKKTKKTVAATTDPDSSSTDPQEPVAQPEE